METNTEHKNDRNDPIPVTGGTGTLGRHVVARLRAAGRDVRVLSRQARQSEQGVELVSGDLDTGEGIDAAVAEEVVAGSGVPWTTLRATQFHELMLAAARGLAKLPVIPVPSGFRFQPVAADEVAARLVELALAEPAGLVPDIAGPRVYAMSELVRGYLRARGKHRLLVPLRLPGKAARAYREGANLSPDRAVGRISWEEFLAERVGVPGEPSPSPA